MARTSSPRRFFGHNHAVLPKTGLLNRFYLLLLFFLASSVPAQTLVTTSQYNNSRTGADLQEKILTPANVNPGQFGKLHSVQVDGDVYAQPLYLSRVNVPGRGRRNLLFVVTEHDSVYAFDADGDFSSPLWHISFVKPDAGVTTILAGESGCPLIRPEIGITSTPVIDPATETLYVVARTKESGQPMQRLHALNVATGAEKFASPVAITAPGFDLMLENPRAALLLADHRIYIGWGSTCDYGSYHGWLMAYDAHTLKQLGALNTSPNDVQSAIWAADAGFAADSNGNIFVATGNGKFDVAAGGADYGDSLLKVSLGDTGLAIRDYFTPFDQEQLNKRDADLGSGGPVLLPDQQGPHPRLVVIGGKGATLYLLDRDRLGKLQTSADTALVQKIQVASLLMGAPAFWQNHLYVQSDQGVLKDFVLKAGKFSAEPAAMTPAEFTAGATPEVTSDGAKNGIVWTLETRAFGFSVGNQPVMLHAYDATNIAHELYNSGQNAARDAAGASLRFTIPAIVNGRVYVGAVKEVDVYGLLASTSPTKN
jgi:hypothetical protein